MYMMLTKQVVKIAAGTLIGYVVRSPGTKRDIMIDLVT
jgi:hypothetical protein